MAGHKEKDVDPLARRFAAARAALGHSQTEVGASLNVSQRTVSNWERGVPPPSLVQVEFLERRAAELLTASRPATGGLGRARLQAQPAGNHLNLLSDDEFFENLKAWVEEWKNWATACGERNSCDFHFLNPRSLPVFVKGSARTTWSRNLAIGINYHVYWFLDVADQTTILENTLNALARIESDARKIALAEGTVNGGKLHLHGLLEAGLEKQAKDLIKLYKSKREAWEKVSGTHFVIEELRDKYDKKHVTRLGQEIPIVIVHVNDKGVERADFPPVDFSACQLMNLSRAINGDPETGWAYMTKDQTKVLLDSITS